MSDMNKGVVLVTGAMGGLGQSVTRLLLESGYDVAALEYHGQAFDGYKASLGALGEGLELHQVDVTDEALVQATFGRFVERHVAAVVHLVGGYTGGVSIDETPLDHLENMIHLNLRGAFLVMREGARLLKAQGDTAGMVFVGSITGRTGAKHHGPYAATKAALHSLVRSAAIDLAEDRIRVNAVLPAMIATPANLQAMPDADHTMWVTPTQIGQTILHLIGDHATAVTGACIEIGGKSYAP